MDQRFFNPGEREVEGWYWFTVPEGATSTQRYPSSHRPPSQALVQ